MSDAMTEIHKWNKEVRLREEQARKVRAELDKVAPEPRVIGGLYQHYKGGLYVVLAIAIYHEPNSMAGSEVTYLQLESNKAFRREVVGTDGFFVTVFNEDNVAVPRFKYIKQVSVQISDEGYEVSGIHADVLGVD